MSDDLVKRLRSSLSILAQEEAADRIEELEAKGLANRVAIMKLEAKLAKVISLANNMAEAIEDQIDICDASMEEQIAVKNYRTTLAEPKGEK